MDEKVKISLTEDYLLIFDEGVRKDLSSAIKGTENIAEAALKYDRQVVLVDYRKVRYQVSLNEAYNLVKVYENKVPAYKDLVMAVVINRQDWELAKFWESVSIKRGYSFKVFDDIETAKDWLKNCTNSISG